MQTRSSSRLQPRALAAAIGLALATSGAEAATFSITSNADAGPGTLRQAIIDANGQAGPHTLDFSAISGQTITLAADLPDITEDMTLQGSQVTLSGDDAHACLRAALVRLAAERMTITGCYSSYGGGIFIYDGELDLKGVSITDSRAYYVGGGAAAVYSQVSIADSTTSGNEAGYYGGGVYLYGSDLRLADSTISGNTARFGGGLAAYADQQATVISGSTISGNQAEVDAGGAISSYSGNIAVRNTTISGNSANDYGGGFMVEIYYAGEPVVLDGVTITGNQAGQYAGGLEASAYAGTSPAGFEIRNSIIAGNTAPGGADLAGGLAGPGGPQAAGGSMQAASAEPGGKASRPWRQGRAERRGRSLWASGWSGSGGSPAGTEGKSGSVPAGVSNSIDINYTLLGSAPASGNFTLDGASTSLVGADPQLGPLAANGGPTWTHLPAAGGAGVNAIPSGQSGCGADFNIDQRGEPRPEVGGNACDLGAVELTGTLPPAEPVSVPVNHPLALGLLGLGAGLLGLLGFGRLRQRS